jgi:D-amino-acid dehydrogenase
MHIAIVGAGLVGVNTAHALLDAQHQVTIIDATGPAAGASQGNAGMIAHVDILPLASPKVWRNLPKWAFDPLGPLSIRPSYLPKLVPWLARFVAASGSVSVERSTRALIALNGAALPAWERRADALGLRKHLRPHGFLSVWATDSDFAAAQPLLRRQNDLGITNTALDAAATRKLEPALRGNLAGGALYDTGVHVSDPRRLTLDLAEAAMQRQARFLHADVARLAPGADGVALHMRDGAALNADRVVLAAGAWSRPLAASLGDAIPLDTERGYNITFPKGRFGLSRPVVFEGQGYVASTLDIGDRVGGAVEFGGLHAPPNWARVDAMLSRLKRFLPDLDSSGGDRWMGFRPSMPDSLPVIGPSPRAPKVIYAFGHGHYGLTQSAITAQIVAALIAGAASPIDTTPFDPARFARIARA